MTDKAGFNLALSELLEVPNSNPQHPYLTVAKFVFADDKPNENGMAVDYSEFDNIKNTAIGMPVKMLFTGAGVDNHVGSVPIGVIRNMEAETLPDNTHRLVAEAVLWPEEYPEEVAYLKTAFAEGNAPGISYELGYKESLTQNGIRWLKQVITLAATFVKSPAYGNRTPLIALAAQMTCQQFADHMAQMAQTAGFDLGEVIDYLEAKQGTSSQGDMEHDPMFASNNKGGNQMEEELEQAKAMAATLTSEIEALKAQLAEKDTALQAAQSEVTSLKQAALIDSRVRKFTEAGFTLEADAEKAEKKKALWASFSEEQFEEYLSDLVSAKASAVPTPPANPALAAIAKASASNAMPKLELKEADIQSLAEETRRLARPYSA